MLRATCDYGQINSNLDDTTTTSESEESPRRNVAKHSRTLKKENEGSRSKKKNNWFFGYFKPVEPPAVQLQTPRFGCDSLLSLLPDSSQQLELSINSNSTKNTTVSHHIVCSEAENIAHSARLEMPDEPKTIESHKSIWVQAGSSVSTGADDDKSSQNNIL